MLRRLIFVVLLALVAGHAVNAFGPLRGAGTAIAAALPADAPNQAHAADPASGTESPDGGLIHGGIHCPHMAAIPTEDAADRGGEGECLRWADLQSFLTRVHLPPSHPPPVSAG